MSDQSRTAECRLVELAVGWALGVLEPAEEALVAAHLVDCSDCARIADETKLVVSVLGPSAAEMTPSPDMERRVVGAETPAGGDSREQPVSGATKPTAPLRGLLAAAPLRGFLAAAVAVILLASSVALGMRTVQLDGELDQAAGQLTAMSAAMDQAADPEVVRVPLVTEDGSPMGVVLAEVAEVTVVPTALPSNRVDDQIYVLWGLADDAPVPLVGFDVAADGPIPHVATVNGTTAFSGYAVSIEPGRHTPDVPTTVMASGLVG